MKTVEQLQIRIKELGKQMAGYSHRELGAIPEH